MSKSIRSQLTPEEIHDRREQRVAEAVAHKLLGTSPPKRPPLPIKSIYRFGGMPDTMLYCFSGQENWAYVRGRVTIHKEP